MATDKEGYTMGTEYEGKVGKGDLKGLINQLTRMDKAKTLDTNHGQLHTDVDQAMLDYIGVDEITAIHHSLECWY